MPYFFGKEEIEAASEVMKDNILDRYIKKDASVTRKLEDSFANYIGVKDSLMVSSGTAALVCSLVGLGIKNGDEVIIPSFTYIATALAVMAVGAIPVVAEIDDTLTISTFDVEKKITNETKCIIPVHMHGFPCNMSEIMEIAQKHKIFVIEDVAQACGGSFKGKKLGSIGDAGAYSFNHFKIITCGEGGALVIKGKDEYKRAEVYQHGGIYFEPGFSYEGLPLIIGNNYRMSEISSAIVLSQLQKLPEILKHLRTDWEFMHDVFKDNEKTWFSLIKSNDFSGDCCRTLGITFKTKEISDLFLKKSYQYGLSSWSMCTSGHICSDWKRLLDANGVHMNNCQRSMELLGRSVGISSMFSRKRSDREKFKLSVNKVVNDLSKVLNGR